MTDIDSPTPIGIIYRPSLEADRDSTHAGVEETRDLMTFILKTIGSVLVLTNKDRMPMRVKRAE